MDRPTTPSPSSARPGRWTDLSRADFDACLAFLAGDLASPPGAFEPEPGAAPRWTSPRIWSASGRFGIRSRRVARWFRINVGTITSEESVRVLADGVDDRHPRRGVRRAAPAGRPVRARRPVAGVPTAGGPDRPRASGRGRARPAPVVERSPVAFAPSWPSRSPPFASEAATARRRPRRALRPGSARSTTSTPTRRDVLVALFEAQERLSEVPRRRSLLVEESPHERRVWLYTFHAPLSRSACEALGRATCAARLGRRFGRDLSAHRRRPRLVDPAS